jgi:taurine dioxygenase
MTADEQATFCKRIGVVQNYHNLDFVKQFTKPIAVHENVLRVTGAKDEDGKEGLFGHTDELDWHANMVSNKFRDPLIWLYAVKGSKGSRTSWLNMVEAWKRMPDDLRERVKTLKMYTGYEVGRVSKSEYFLDHVGEEPFDMYYKNSTGVEGLFFPFLQIFGIEENGEKVEDHQAIIDEILHYVDKEDFMYHHDWEDGDVVISDQWLSLHKRWEFADMENRLLHRIAFRYGDEL